MRHQCCARLDGRFKHARHHVIRPASRNDGLVNQFNGFHAAHFGARVRVDNGSVARRHHADSIVENDRRGISDRRNGRDNTERRPFMHGQPVIARKGFRFENFDARC